LSALHVAGNLYGLAYSMPGSVPGGKTNKTIQGSVTPVDQRQDRSASADACDGTQWCAVCLDAGDETGGEGGKKMLTKCSSRTVLGCSTPFFQHMWPDRHM
jgi:hypothetical protein